MIWLSLITITLAIGIVTAMVAAAIFGLTIHYDYWSNTVEFLAAALVLAAPGMGWPWWSMLALGLVLGTGRETLPFLAILGTLPAIMFAVGAALGHVGVRLFARTESTWEGSLDYATPMWRTNWEIVRGIYGPDTQWRATIYFGIAIAAALVAPGLALALVAVTLLITRIDEPRVLTQLIPFAAVAACRLSV